MALKGTEIIEKSNTLNEIRLNGMTLQELRFFSIYLAKINARDINTRKVTFPLNDFRKIMELGRMNIKHFQTVTNGLLCKVYNQPNDDGGYTGFTLFKRCRVYKNDIEEWFVEIEASDDALPLMFNMRNRYFKYELWNALRCRSANQIALYELLKQYENIGRFEINIPKLREKLDLITEYPRWSDFKTRVLDSCQQALTENTNITFTYERGKTGTGGKWLTIVFYITKNENYIDQLTLDEFIEQQEDVLDVSELTDEEKADQYSSEALAFIAGACDYEFSDEEMKVLFDMILQMFPHGKQHEIERYNYIMHKYNELKLQASKRKINSRFGYLKKMIEHDLKEKL